jgi:uncharacterized protein (TIGR02265 family)
LALAGGRAAGILRGMSAAPPVVYSHTVQAVLSRVFARRSLLTGPVVARLAALGVDVKHPRDVPVEAWRPVVRLAAETIAPGQPDEDAFREVGREMMRGFEATALGKAVFLVMRLFGNRRGMLRLAEQYRTADNATRVETRELNPTTIELRFTVEGGIPHPTYNQGILMEALHLLNAKSPRVTWQAEPSGTVVFVVSWS